MKAKNSVLAILYVFAALVFFILLGTIFFAILFLISLALKTEMLIVVIVAFGFLIVAAIVITYQMLCMEMSEEDNNAKNKRK